MKHRLVFFVLALFVIINTSFSQTQPFTFKVLVSKGKTEVKTADAWESVKIGSSLKASDEVKVSENAYLALIHANGTPLEVKDAGSYKVSALVSRLPKGASALNKYTDFILSKQEDKKNRLGATGAVERKLKDMILVYLPGSERSGVFGDKVYLEWSADEVAGPYFVIFTNLMGEELGKFETDKPNYTVAVNEGNFKREYEIMVKVISKNTPGQGSKDYTLKKLRPLDRQKFTTAFDEVKSSINTETALGKYMLAGFYEENFLLIDAFTAYHDAALMAPEVDLYKTAYEDFLKRMEFK